MAEKEKGGKSEALKKNPEQTLDRFDRFWGGGEPVRLVVADVKRPGPLFKDIDEYSDKVKFFERHFDYLLSGSFHGDAIPDISPYLGPGSLATFIGAEPIYSNGTIWYESNGASLEDVYDACSDFIENSDKQGKSPKWYKWSLETAKFLKSNEGKGFFTSMPDLEQNMDILSAVMGPSSLLMALSDDPEGVEEVLEILYKVWEKAYEDHLGIISQDSGHSAFTHYNIIGKGATSILQSDISCMLSRDMYDRFEMPFLNRQAGKLDNVIYHMDGPGADRHLDSILTIDKLTAVQWVPGEGNPGNSAECWDPIYEKITKAGKGLYVFLEPGEIDDFIDKYANCRMLIRTLAKDEEDQKRISEKYCKG